MSIESILKKQQVYYSSPLSFNDPFECKPHFVMPTKEEVVVELLAHGALKSSLKSKTRKILKGCKELLPAYQSRAMEYVEKYGIFCLKSSNTNLLMWAHYAQDHKGLCFEFEVDIEGVYVDDDFGSVGKVKYSSDYPKLNMLLLHQLVFCNVQNDQKIMEFLTNLMLTKSIDWLYEQEYRGVLSPIIGGGIGLKSFESRKLKSVTFGARAEESFIKKTVELIGSYPSEIEVKKAQISNSKFRLIISKSTHNNKL